MVKLVRQWSCNRHTLEGEWSGILPAREAARLFARAEQLEQKADEEDRLVMVTDGTLFEFAHKRGERVYRGRLSAGAQGHSGELSRLMLGVAARFVRGGLPTTPDWTQSSELTDVAYQAREAACGSTVFRARYRNVSGPGRRGHVEEVTIGGQSLQRIAGQLDISAGRRFISDIAILSCDTDGERPIFRGVLKLPELESRARSLRWDLYFTIRHGPEGWTLSFD